MGEDFERAPFHPKPSSTRRAPRTPMRPALLWLGLLIIASPILLVIAANGLGRSAVKIDHARTMIEQLGVAFGYYQKEYGHYPPLSVADNAKIHALFNGDNVDDANRHGIQFFVFNHKEVSVNGEMLDPWGTPYRITYDEKGPVITSAGPDHTFDTKDDISNRAP